MSVMTALEEAIEHVLSGNTSDEDLALVKQVFTDFCRLNGYSNCDIIVGKIFPHFHQAIMTWRSGHGEAWQRVINNFSPQTNAHINWDQWPREVLTTPFMTSLQTLGDDLEEEVNQARVEAGLPELDAREMIVQTMDRLYHRNACERIYGGVVDQETGYCIAPQDAAGIFTEFEEPPDGMRPWDSAHSRILGSPWGTFTQWIYPAQPYVRWIGAGVPTNEVPPQKNLESLVMFAKQDLVKHRFAPAFRVMLEEGLKEFDQLEDSDTTQDRAKVTIKTTDQVFDTEPDLDTEQEPSKTSAATKVVIVGAVAAGSWWLWSSGWLKKIL